MPDPIDTNLPPASTPTPSPVAEPAPAPATDLPNPQDAVNAALNTSTPIAEPSTSTSSAVPAAEPMPPLEPLSQTPKVETVTTVESPSVSASGDDVPLSLVTPPAAPTVTTTTTTTPPADTTAPTPVVTTTTTTTPPAEEPAAALPPVSPLPPAPSDGFKPLPEKKKKGSKVILGVLGFFLMVGILGFGYYYFTGGVVPQVACVGYKECQEWKKDRDRKDQINANSKQAQYGGYAGGGTGPNSNAFIGSKQEKEGQINAIKDSAVQAAKTAGYAADSAEVKAIQQKAADAIAALSDDRNTALDSSGKPVNKDAQQIISVLTDAAVLKGKALLKQEDGGVPAGMYALNPDGDLTDLKNLRVINAVGVTDGLFARALADPNSIEYRLLTSPVNQGGWGMTQAQLDIAMQQKLLGLTFVPGGVGCYQTGATSDEGPVGTPNDPTNDSCTLPHWTMCVSATGIDGVGCDVRQPDTPDNPEDNPSPSPSGSSSLVCTGITRAPATTPVVGSVLTFTCAGTVTPATTLSYDFRYSLNDATPSALVNKTATTAELTINACGTYKVQCRACATIAGVKQCSPVWVGATQ